MYQAGTATENALLFKETQDFNVKLQDEVKNATSDLQQRNRRLTVLRKLDNIILNTLDINDLSQKSVDLVSWEMGFNGALLVLIEQEKGKRRLRATALSSTPILTAALKMLPKSLTEYSLPWGLDPSNLYYRSINERKPLTTSDFSDLYVPPLSPKLAKTLQTITHAKYVVVYPLLARDLPLGAISFDIPKPYAELTNDEKELIESFVDELGIAIDNRKLYLELQEKNAELKETNMKLKELDQMKDELVSVASHELRTPLTVIKSYLWMALNKQTGALNEALTRYLERAYQSSDRMIYLVNDMLSASRLEGRRVELNMQSMDIRRVITDVVTGLVTKADEKNLKLYFNPPQGEFPNVMIDEARMIEILTNLVGNAVKYTQQGEIWVELEIRDTASAEDEKNADGGRKYLWVLVKDTGQGISQEDISRLFKKFGKLEQGSYTRTAETGGTGLGLYITKELVKLHGGKIWVESEVGKGSAFIFSVRLAG
jgi:signal transduction histidine kinase